MRHQVAVLSTVFMDECVSGALEPLGDRCEFVPYYYKDSSEIPDIFGGIEKKYDGFLVNGAVSRAILRLSFPEEPKPIETIHMDLLSYYRELLKLAVSLPGFDMERAYVDFMDGKSLRDQIACGTLDAAAERYCSGLETMPAAQLEGLKNRFVRQAETAWREKRIDLVITRFSTAVDELRERKIPCYFIFPGKAYIREVAGRLLMRLDMERSRESWPASVRIGCAGGRERYDELRDLNLLRAVLEFSREFGLDFVVRSRTPILEILTSAGTVERITGHFSSCGLKERLEKEIGEPVRIGYGIGRDMEQARRAAGDASREAAGNPGGASFLMDEQERLIGPLAAGERLVLSAAPKEEYERLAEATGLSALTLQKIWAIASREDGRIVTAHVLADRMGLTARATSKYLQKLVESGQARIVGRKQRKTRGRPELLVCIGGGIKPCAG